MARKSKTELLFLFEDEIRLAASSVEAFLKLNDLPEAERQDDVCRVALIAMVRACDAALHGASDENNNLVLCKKDIFARAAIAGVKP